MRKLLNSELERPSIKEFKEIKKQPIAVVLDNIRSLNNIGSVFRTSDAFLISEVLLCGITATPPNRDIHKTALGATESVAWKYFDDTTSAISYLKEKGFNIISIEQAEGSIDLNSFNIQKEEKYALIFGNEVKGVSQDIVNISDYCIELPQYGTKHSLNISVCAGIVLWEFFKKMKF